MIQAEWKMMNWFHWMKDWIVSHFSSLRSPLIVLIVMSSTNIAWFGQNGKGGWKSLKNTHFVTLPGCSWFPSCLDRDAKHQHCIIRQNWWWGRPMPLIGWLVCVSSHPFIHPFLHLMERYFFGSRHAPSSINPQCVPCMQLNWILYVILALSLQCPLSSSLSGVWLNSQWTSSRSLIGRRWRGSILAVFPSQWYWFIFSDHLECLSHKVRGLMTRSWLGTCSAWSIAHCQKCFPSAVVNHTLSPTDSNMLRPMIVLLLLWRCSFYYGCSLLGGPWVDNSSGLRFVVVASRLLSHDICCSFLKEKAAAVALSPLILEVKVELSRILGHQQCYHCLPLTQLNVAITFNLLECI